MVHGLTPARTPPGGSPPQAEPRVSKAPMLIGHGYDIHRLDKSDGQKRLTLAGVVVSDEIMPIAHSDGDVIFHALVDAIFGALGLGDIGEHFGDTDPRWKDADSSVFVKEAVERARKSRYRVSNVDVSLLLERPKVAPFKIMMTDNLRRLLEGASVVNIKAATNEGLDAIGRGEAVAAHAVVLLMAELST
jgi:2-C-methyl-D-erythritol 2,4-cyclodiphosphate synthase